MAQNPLTNAWRYLFGQSPPTDTSMPRTTTLLPVFEDHPDNPPATRTPIRLKKFRREIGSPRQPPLSTTKRHRYGGWGCTIYGWPSTGGVIIREQADLVELHYLSINPFSPPPFRFPDQDEEDAFCLQLKKIGGKWWKSEQRCIDVWVGDLHPDTVPSEEELRQCYIGWPENGGVLILGGDESVIPPEVGMLRMVGSMGERCALLRDKLGARYYKDWEEYGGLEGLGPRLHEKSEEDEEDGGKEEG